MIRKLFSAIAVAGLTANAALPTGWNSGDIGDVGSAGSTEFLNGVWTVKGSGDGFKSDDECRFVYQQVTGNFEITARVTQLPESGRIGVMVRESLADDSRFEMLYLNTNLQPKGDGRNSERLYKDPSSDGYSKTMPVTLCMKRYGDEVGLYVIDDPANPGRVKDRATLDGLAATVYAGLVVTSENDGSLVTGEFDSVSLQPLQREYKTSWLGNTWAGSFKHVQMEVYSMAVHPGNDRFYLGSATDEGDLFKAMYRLSNGEQISGVEKQLIHKRGGYAVAATTDHIYWASTFKRDGGHYIFRTNQVGWRSGFANGDHRSHMRFITSKGLIKGMAINEDAGEVYVSNTPEDNVQVYDLEMQHLRTFKVASPESIAVDGAGNLWIVSGHEVKKYTPKGKFTGVKTDRQIVDPRGIAVAPDGKLWVCEFGPRSFIMVFKSNGRYFGNFGASGGIASNTYTAPGVVHPLKFNGPVGVGFDGDGNVVVACNSMLDTDENTTEIRKLTQSGNLIWESYGLEWMDIGCPDKTTDGEYFYTDNRKYKLDFSKTDGQEWSYEAYTVDPLNYPEDPRKHERTTGSFIRHINGKRFLFVTKTNDDMIVYRFDGEIAVPAFMIRSGKGKIPANRPSNSMWKWRDANGDGLFDESEFSSIPDHDYWQWFADDAGDIWSVTKDGKVVYCELTGVDANDVPNYSVSVENDPSEFTEASRCYYDSGNDIMYIGGYTKTNPKPSDAKEWRQYGREIIRYNNWKKGNRKPAVPIVVPYTPKSRSAHDTYVCQNIWVEGDYVFTNISASGEIIAYNKDTGSMVQRFVPGPEVGGRTGLIDLTHALTAIRRPNGEYIIFQESNDQCKILMFRWKPED